MDFNKTNLIPLQTSDAVAASPKRAMRADAAANRELILTTVKQLFCEQGVDQVCMTAIAEAAGVGKGTLYRAFANKGELCLALMDEDMCHFQNTVLQMFRAAYDQPALTRLDTFLDMLVRFMDHQAPLLREAQMQGMLRHTEETSEEEAPRWTSWLHGTLGLLLQEAQQNGEAPELDIPYLVEAIMAPLNADLFLHQRQTLGFDLERISCGLRHLILNGCRG